MQTNKIFIGKLSPDLTEEHLRDYFSTFGEIDEIQFVFNKQTNERKSFCFIQFKEVMAVEQITRGKVPPESVRHVIDSIEVECKKKFDDNHPVQRKIKAIERQRKGMWGGGDFPPVPYGYGNYYGGAPGGYDFYSGYGYYGGYYGGHHGYHGGGGTRDIYGYGYEDYSSVNYTNGGGYGGSYSGGKYGNRTSSRGKSYDG